MPELPEPSPPESLPPAPFDHVVRRQIVRCLNELEDDPLSPSDLTELLGTRVGVAAYHLMGLKTHRNCNAVELFVGGSRRSGAKYLFKSTVADDPEVTRILEETLEHDEELLPRKKRREQ